MTWLSLLLAYFPALHAAMAIAALLGLILDPTLGGALALLFAVYVFPLFCFRILGGVYPLVERASRISERRYSPWWGGHQTQLLFEAVPALEALLRVVPGAYSAWLRAWGSKVGKGIYWTPSVRISDRSLMEIGDHVVFGHQVECFAHFVTPGKKGLLLYVKRVRIGAGCFLGAYVRLGPGVVLGAKVELGTWTRVGYDVRVADGTRVPPDSGLWPKQSVSDADFADAPTPSAAAAATVKAQA